MQAEVRGVVLYLVFYFSHTNEAIGRRFFWFH